MTPLPFPPPRHTMKKTPIGRGIFMNCIGIDLGGTNIKGALVSEQGKILREHAVETRVDLGPEAVAARIGQVIAQLSDGEDTVGGVGVGCPGTVDDASGIVRFAANLSFANFDLRSALRAYTSLPIRLGNDANAAALGEALFGCGKGAESTIVVTLGTGVGGGVVLGGRLLTGYTGAASELGHMVITEGGEPCTCGRRGCFEAYCSATALIRDTKRAMAAHPKSLLHAIAAEQGCVDGRTAFLAGECGDEAGAQVVEEYIEHLACGLTNLVNIFFPEVLALSGGVAEQGDALLAPLREKVRERSFGSRYAASHTRIERCALGYRAGVIGAAMLARP